MQKHTKLETGDHAGGGRRRTSASPAPPVMQRISHVHLIRRGVAAAPPSPHRQRRCTISSEAGLAPLGLPRGCAHPTSTSSVAATSVMCCASDARLSGAALRKTETKNSAPHRTDAGRSFVTAAAQARLPFRWLSGCLSAGYPVRLPFCWLFCAAAFPQPFLCACGHRAAFLTRPSRSCPRATPRTGCAYGRSGGRTPSSPATTAGRTR